MKTNDQIGGAKTVRSVGACAALLWVMTSGGMVLAEDRSYDSGGWNSDLGTCDNWDWNTCPTTEGAAVLRFGGGGHHWCWNNLGSWEGVRFNQIYWWFGGGGEYNLNGNAFRLGEWGGSEGRIRNDSSTAQKIECNLKLETAVGVDPVNGDLWLSGAINNNGQELRVRGANDKMLTLSGTISGTGKLLVQNANGYAKVKLNGSSTFTGDVGIDTGEFWVDAGGALGAGTIYVGVNWLASSAAKLWLADSDGGLTVSRDIVVNSGDGWTRFVGGLNTSGENTLSGGVMLNGPVILDQSSGGTLALTGIIGGDQDVTKANSGTVKLTAQNTFGNTKTLSLDNGTLDISPASGTDPLDVKYIKLGYQTDDVTLKLSGSQNFTLDVVSGGNIEVRSTSGTKKIFNAQGDNTISAPVTLTASLTEEVASGTVLTHSGAIGSGGGVTKTGDGTLALGAANTYTGDTAIQAGTLRLTANDCLSDSTLVNVSGGATFDMNEFYDKVKGLIGAGNVYVGTGGGDRLRVGGDNADRTFSGVISEAGNVVKEGTGVWTLSGANTYTGDTKIENGTLRLGANDRLSDSTLVNVSGGATFDMNEFYDKVKGLIGAGNVYVGTGGGDRLRVGGDNVDRTFSGVISEAGNVVKEGTGVWILSGANTYTGDTKIENGTLRLGANDRMSDSTLVDVWALGIFDMDDRYDKVKGLIGAGNVTLGTAGGDRLRVGADNASRLFSGVISEAGNVIKEGSGTWTLSGGNTYSGNTIINGGTLALSGAGTIANSPVISIAGGATFSVAGRSGTLTLASGKGITVTATGSASPATIVTALGIDLATAGNSPLAFSSFSSAGGAPLAIAGAGLVMLSGGDSVTVTVTGGALADGSYTLISKGASGGVSGTAPTSVSVGGNGVAPGALSSLAIVGNELVLLVETPVTVPVLTSPSAALITTGGATLGATISGDGGAAITERGTVWGTSANPEGNALAAGGTDLGAFSHARSGMTAGTLILYRGYADNSIGRGYSADATFWTVPNAPTANEESNVGATDFDANWSAATGATGYRLDVATDSGFSSKLPAYDNLNVGAVVTYPVSGLSPGETYYYRVRAVNSGGTSANSSSITAITDVGCAPGLAPILAPLSNQTGTSNVLFSFDVYASDPGCDPPALSAVGLPAGASFSTVISGTNRIGTFSWTPQAVGTFPVRFTATDSDLLATDKVMLVYVAAVGEATNSAGVPASQTNWHVAITNLVVPSSGNATVVWTSVDGVTYDLYSSTLPIGGGASWSKVVSGQEADGVLATASVSTVGSMTFYQVVPEGGTRADRGVWGIVKPTIPSAFHLMSPPIVGDRSLADAGEFGQALAAVAPEGAKIHIATDSVPNWTTLEEIGGVWRTDPGTLEYNTPLNAGQAFYLQGASGTTPVFSGPVGNMGTQSVALAVGFNLLGVSEGKGIAASTGFESALPIGNNNENLADMIVIQHANGTWRRLVRQTTPSNRWYDMTTRGATSVILMPGEAYYYIRRTSSTSVRF